MNTNIRVNYVFKFVANNGLMSLIISDNDRVISQISNEIGLVEVNTQINLPTKITIEVSGKSPGDTTVVNDKIVADKYICLVNMTVGGIPVTQFSLFNILNYEHSGKIWHDSYWGFNGKITIDFNSDNFIKWHLLNRNVFELVT